MQIADNSGKMSEYNNIAIESNEKKNIKAILLFNIYNLINVAKIIRKS